MTEKLLANLEKVREMMDKYYNEIDDIYDNCDTSFSDALAEIQSQFPDNRKYTKKEKKALLVKIIIEKMPDFVRMLDEFDLVMEGMSARIELSRQKLEEKMEALEEIESLQEELEEKKSELDI